MKLGIQNWQFRMRDAMQSRTSPTSGTNTPSQKRIMSFTAVASGIVLFLLTYYARTWHSLAYVIKICPNQFCDFIDYYYPMGDVIFSTGLPIEGFLYSPFIGILLAVFPPLGLSTSLVLWGILQILFVSLYILLLRWLIPVRFSIQLFFIVLVLTSYPPLLNLMGGQVSFFIVVAILGMLVCNERGNLVAGAGLLAFAVSFKFYPLIFLVPFALRRDIRYLILAIAACVTVLFLIPGVLLGFNDTLAFYGALLNAFSDSDWVVINPHSQFFPHLFFRFAGSIGYDSQMYLLLLHWISFGIAAVNMGVIFLVQRARFPYADLWSFQLVFLTIPFVLKTSWPHDFIFLPFTQAFIVWWLLEGEKTILGKDKAENHFYVSTMGNYQSRTKVMVIFVILSIVLSNVIFFNIIGSFPIYGFCGFLFWSSLFLLIVSYMILLPSALKGLRMKDVNKKRRSSMSLNKRVSGGSIQ